MYSHYLTMDMKPFFLDDKYQVAVLPWFTERMLGCFNRLFLLLFRPFEIGNYFLLNIRFATALSCIVDGGALIILSVNGINIVNN